MNTEETINQLASDIFLNAVNKGFHDRDNSESVVDNYARWAANIHGETSELWEAARRGKLEDQCDKDCVLTCEEEELADIIIRALDTAQARNLNIGRAVLVKMAYNSSRPHMHGGKLA